MVEEPDTPTKMRSPVGASFSLQTTTTVLMIRPACFGFNTETAQSNAFQTDAIADVQSTALTEFDRFVEKLRGAGVEVIVVEDTTVPLKPDAIFPNNWASCHADGTVILYPMMAQNRRAERRMDIIDQIAERFQVREVVDLSGFEAKETFLESTGSIVFDHQCRKAYACISPRTDEQLLKTVCTRLGYEAVTFRATDKKGKAIYHTNVMMNIGPGFAVVCTEAISADDRDFVLEQLEIDKKDIIDISITQLEKFAGNMLCLQTVTTEHVLILSQQAHESLSEHQLNGLSTHARLLPIDIRTIETTGGGSVRCMMTEIFLPKKPAQNA